MHTARPIPRHTGTTLLEMLAALGICAILAALAGPTLARQRAESSVRAAADRTLAALQLARRIALARGQSVTVCPSADGTTCGFGGAEWLLFANLPGGSESRRETGEELLRRWTLPARVTAHGTRGYAAFEPRPGAAATVTFDFCYRASPWPHLGVVVSQTGRPRVARTAPADVGPTCDD